MEGIISSIIDLIDALASVIGVIGVVVGVLVAERMALKREARARKERTEQEERLRADHANYLATRVISTLDMFVVECFFIVRDRGFVEEGEDILEGVIPIESLYSVAPFQDLPNTPELTDNVDWKAIDSKLVDEIFSLKNLIKLTNTMIKGRESDIVIPLEDYSYLYECRWYEYSQVGLRASNIMLELGEKYKISGKNGYTSSALKAKQTFSDTIKAIDKIRENQPGRDKMFRQKVMEAMTEYKKSGKPFPRRTKREKNE